MASTPVRPRTLRLPRWTVRLRLTVLYGSLFLVSGAALITIAYLLVTQRIFGSALIIRQKHFYQGTEVPPGTDGAPPAPTGELAGSAMLLRGGPMELWQKLLLLSGIALAIMLVLSIVLGWLVAGRALRPLRTMTATTRQISEDNLHERLDVAGPDDELKDLAVTINGLLTRLDTAFDTQKDALDAQQRFVANASHELRGPLTLERATLEIALADPAATAQSLRAACERVLATSKQQEGLIDALLTLARGQRGLDQYEPINLATVADDVLLARRAQAQRRGLRVDTALAAAPAQGDPRLTERLVVNLVDNAIHHNVSGGSVRITTAVRDGSAVLSVANSGPAIPPAEIDRLLRPFQRLGTDRTDHSDGHGLGLSIVAAVAAAHSADLHVQALTEGGLEVIVTFPQSPDLAHGFPSQTSVNLSNIDVTNIAARMA